MLGQECMRIIANEGNELNEGQNPLVSIIVRTKDRPKLLKRALKSIADQNYRPIEVVLVNDGGCALDDEDIRRILGNVSLNYICLETNAGRAHAANVGIGSAKGKYIGFLDDDDELYPIHLVTLVPFLEQSDYKVAYTDSLMVYKEYNSHSHELNHEVKREVAFSYDFNYDRLVFENYIPLMCLLFERELVVTSGGFDPSLELYEDWDLLIRIGEKYPFYHIKQVTANYNQWSVDFQISQANRDMLFTRQAYEEVISRHIKKITPGMIHNIISEYAYNRRMLKDLIHEAESYKNFMRETKVQIDSLNAEVREREDRINTLSGELKEKEVQMQNLISESGERASRIDSLNAEVREREDRIKKLSGELKEKEVQINNLSGELKEKDLQINNLISESGERASRIDSLNTEVSARDTQLSALASLMSEREAESTTLKNTVHERDALITAMTNTRGWRILEKFRKVRDVIPGFSFFSGSRQKKTGRSER